MRVKEQSPRARARAGNRTNPWLGPAPNSDDRRRRKRTRTTVASAVVLTAALWIVDLGIGFFVDVVCDFGMMVSVAAVTPKASSSSASLSPLSSSFERVATGGNLRRRPEMLPNEQIQEQEQNHPFNPNARDSLWRMELFPTSSLVVQNQRRRQRRRRRMAGLDNIIDEDETMEDWPKDWFHPQSRAVYATLHPDFDDPSNDDNDGDQVHNDKAQLHYRDFVRHRHLSRYERLFRESLGLDLHAGWQGNYSDPGDAAIELHDERRLLRAVLRVRAANANTTANATGNATATATANNQSKPTPPRQRQRGARGNSRNNTAAAHFKRNNHNQNRTKSTTKTIFLSQRKTRRQQQRQRHRRKLLQSLVGGTFDRYQGVPLSQGYGTHYVHLWVGAPIPQRQTVIVDTGSHFTGFPVEGECKNCGEAHHTDPHFDPSKSETFRPLACPNECVENHFECEVTAATGAITAMGASTTAAEAAPRCKFTQAYTEGSSWTAYQARDKVYCGSGADLIEAVDPLDTQYSISFVFGCLQENTGLFQTQLADGIMGMSAHELTLPKQLYNEGKIEYNMFAMCFRKELGTSRRGVTAGSMTLGGVSSVLDTSPMVYARNLRPFGWYTVYLENVYVATKGGHRFAFDDPDKSPSWYQTSNGIVPIRTFDPVAVNRDRGVIVDSGTTDTYIPSGIREEFCRVWREATGSEYSNGAIVLTQFQLQNLPTLLLQFRASPSHGSHDRSTAGGSSTKPVLGQVGYLDPTRKEDVLLAVPATSYMEYSPTLKVYTSRLFFTETKGGVIGANSMQGHNVLFDWHHGRIGFAQSSCAYDLLAGKNDNHHDFVGARSDLMTIDRCHLSGTPFLTKTCWDSIVEHPTALVLCEESFAPTNVEVAGTEIWTLAVELPGTNDPSRCEDAMREWSESRDTTHQVDPSTTVCTPDGLCHEHRPCHVPCADAMAYKRQKQEQEERRSSPQSKKTKSKHKHTEASSSSSSSSSPSTTKILNEAVTIPHPVVNRTTSAEELSELCPEWMWSACDHSCHQSRSTFSGAVEHTNGQYYCIESSRETRSCHVDACGRSDPCVVPFLVHAIFVLEAFAEGGEGEGEGEGNDWPLTFDELWSPSIEEDFRWKLTHAAHHPRVYDGGNVMFGPGDVNVLVARPWYGDDDESGDGLVDRTEDVGVEKTKATANANNNNNNNNNNNAETGETAGLEDDDGEPPPLGVQLILQISISNPRAIPNPAPKHRLLLQEVGVVWSNLTSVFRPSKPTSVCDPFDLYPLAKTANLVADSILSSPAFLSLLAAGTNDKKDWDKADDNHNDDDRLMDYHPDDERAETLLPAIYTARLTSSWTIGTQIYDGSVNYLGPLASTPFFPIVRFLHEAFTVMFALWLVFVVLRSIRLLRVGAVRIIKKLKKWRHPDSYNRNDPISRDHDGEMREPTPSRHGVNDSNPEGELSSLLALFPSSRAPAATKSSPSRIELTTTTSHLGSRVKKRITR